MREAYLRRQGNSSDDLPDVRPLLPTEVEALLDYRGGLEEYHRDDRRRRDVIAQYRHNLRRMVALSRDAGVDLILVNPAASLRDSPPFKSEHRAGLDAQQREKWESLCREGRKHLCRKHHHVHEAIPLLEQACEIDPLHAGTWYTLAECYLAVGKIEPARDAYLRAKELDVCPLRILEPMNEAVLEVARETQTPLVDLQRLLEQHSLNGIIGGDLFLDHVHPGIKGHQLIADEIADELVALGVVRPGPDWRQRKKQAFRAQREGLDDLYFLKGSQRLENIRGWAQGRSEAVRPTPSSPDEAR